MKKKSDPKVSNTKIAVIFFAFLAVVVGISLLIKLVIVIRNGQFNDSGRFNLSVSNGRNIEIMSLSPDPKDVSTFRLNSNLKSEEVGKLLEIPIDGFIISDSLDLDQKLDSLFFKTILGYNKLKTNLTVVDLMRLMMLSRDIPENSVRVKTVEDANAVKMDSVVGRLVTDPLIENDRQTIQIINGTGIGGLGSRLAKLVTNMGGNVIMVATQNTPSKKSSISYIEEKTYTVNRLQKILGYETLKSPEITISDITITIGEDGISSNPF